MGFFEIFGMIFLGVILLNAVIGIWAIKTAKSSDDLGFSHEENFEMLKVGKI